MLDGHVVPDAALVSVTPAGSSDRTPRCSGLALDGMVVTSASVLRDTTQVTLVIAGSSYDGTVVARDPFTDIAVIEPARGAPLHPLTPGPTAGTGTTVALVATDGQVEPITVTGRVTGEQQVTAAGNGHDVMGLIATSVRLPESGPGAPLVDAEGRLVGMVVDSAGHLAMAVPVDTLRQVAQALWDTGHPVRVWLGMKVVGTDRGVEVHTVTGGSPAAAAGVARGDVITAVDGQPVASLVAFFATVRSHQAGVALTLTVQRAERSITLVAVPVEPGPRAPTAAADAALGPD
jgi:S1-C subfamily serine protease